MSHVKLFPIIMWKDIESTDVSTKVTRSLAKIEDILFTAITAWK